MLLRTALEQIKKCKKVWNLLKKTGTMGNGFASTFTK
jgi:hypothetical protein